jgi:hypothetical protein
MKFTLRTLALIVCTLTFVSIAQAQASRTWVSGVGDDANPCSRTAPCKTWAGAISKTAAGGEIDALDPAGFGAVSITKSITLDGTGTLAAILASGSNGININAGTNDVVAIRGITINGFGQQGLKGINILQAKAVNIEDCVIFGFLNEGIFVSETSDINLNVRNTVVRDNGGDGISVATTAGIVKATLDNVSSTGNSNGLHVFKSSRVVANNCVFSNNTTNGVLADADFAFATIRIWNSSISVNGANGVRAGLLGGGASGVELGQNQINHNTGNGVFIGTGGGVETFANNSIRGNGVDGCAGCIAVGPGN